MDKPQFAKVIDSDELNIAKYQETLLGKVGNKDDLNIVVIQFENEKPMALEIGDAKQMLYDILGVLRHTDDVVAEELYQAFKGVFQARQNRTITHYLPVDVYGRFTLT